FDGLDWNVICNVYVLQQSKCNQSGFIAVHHIICTDLAPFASVYKVEDQSSCFEGLIVLQTRIILKAMAIK
ncbi:MAG: hypothetical protein ACK5F9_02575, partial [Bacteroidota bacterium]